MTTSSITADFLFESHYVAINNSRLHYIREGKGEPLLFLHGVPTWSYVWRNVIPGLTDVADCIAPDLIGFGRSEKPDIAYGILDHVAYIEALIDALALDNITLVLHGWGSVIGFEYFRRHPQKIRAIAFMESYIRAPEGWDALSLPAQELASILARKDGGYDAIMNQNYFVNHVLPSGVLRRLSEKEMAYYCEPFQQAGDCQPIWQYLHDFPIDGSPKEIISLMENYSKHLENSKIPKLMLYAIPGYMTTVDTISWADRHLKNLTLIDIGEDLHYLQETHPSEIATEIKQWYQALSS